MPKISELTAVTSPVTSDELPIVNTSETKKITVANLVGDTGTAELDFGAFPGASDTSVAVTGQTGIASGAVVTAWIFPADTTDHSADEHLLETLKVYAGNVVAGTGFTIYGVNSSQLNESMIYHNRIRDGGGRGTLLYGKFNIAWSWRN